jgi:histidinol phosphatase-like enzyme (inositol monophosphatase family)
VVSIQLDNLMDFAVRTAERAGRITLEHFGRVVVDRKADGSEVTAADHAAEDYIRRMIAEKFPDDGIVGEEGASVAGTSGRNWIIDPIDGTRIFASGVPLYGVLIAVETGGVPILGCCHMPGLREMIVAAKGAGAWHNGGKAEVSAVETLAEARVVTSGLEYWRDWTTEAGKAGFDTLVDRTRFARTWGDCYGFLLVATGRAEIMVDPVMASWDAGPFPMIVSEAGGRFTSITGEFTMHGKSGISTNGRLHAEVLKELATP